MLEGLAAALMIATSPLLAAANDFAGERRWVVTLDGVEIYAPRKETTMKRVPLPGWQWAGQRHGCAPGLAIGPAGEAVITSDTLASLWRVDAATLAVSRHEPLLDAGDGEDVGFSAIAWAAEAGVYFALSHDHGSLWRIDPQLRRAQRIPLSEPARFGCGVTVQARGRFLQLCVRTARGGLTIRLAPDQRWGYVDERRCAN